MLVTKNLADLCAILIDEIHGELPSRIFSTLLIRGRLNIAQLRQYTSLSMRRLRSGLCVLIQHDLLFFHTEPNSTNAFYQANVEQVYNILRAGKILEIVETSHGGRPAKDVMQSLLLLGHTRIEDLTAAYQAKIDAAKLVASNPHEISDESTGVNDNTGDRPDPKTDLAVSSCAQLNSILCRLVEADLVEVVHARTFDSPEDTFADVANEVDRKYYPGGIKGGKAKVERDARIVERLREVREESKSLKRKLDGGVGGESSSKRRKLFHGVKAANGTRESEQMYPDPLLEPKHVIRVNYERCNVELRNRRLVQCVADVLGETTAYVYAVLLVHLTRDLPRCRLDPVMDRTEDGDVLPREERAVTTMEILDSLKTSVDLFHGLGRAKVGEVSWRAAERIRPVAPKTRFWVPEAAVDGDGSADEDSEVEDGSEGDFNEHEGDFKEESAANGTKVRFADAPEGEERSGRSAQLRQHLLILSESKQRFVRHRGRDEWTVDLDPLMQMLREVELDTFIEQISGRHGLRLAHILRQEGKLDEKMIHSKALMKRTDVQRTLVEMEVAGFVHVQEVPKDTKHDVKKSFFLWFCDLDRATSSVLDTTYKSMVHCFEALEALRQRDSDVLALTRRTDVKGKEKDVMRKEFYQRYARFLERETKLMGQVMRLDDVVAVLRDY